MTTKVSEREANRRKQAASQSSAIAPESERTEQIARWRATRDAEIESRRSGEGNRDDAARRTRRRILSYDDLRREKGIRFSRQWLVKLIKNDKFPASVKIGAASVGFIESEIDDWIDCLIEQRDEIIA